MSYVLNSYLLTYLLTHLLKGKGKNWYQELKAEVQKKLRVARQQQLEGTCAELKAANAKGNSRQVFQIVISMTRKFQPRLQCIQSATGDNLTEAAQIADRWKGNCEDCTTMRKGMELNMNIGSKSLHHFVQRLLMQSDRHNNNNDHFTALCLGLPGWAGTRRNTHPPIILIIIQSSSASSIYHDP